MLNSNRPEWSGDGAPTLFLISWPARKFQVNKGRTQQSVPYSHDITVHQQPLSFTLSSLLWLRVHTCDMNYGDLFLVGASLPVPRPPSCWPRQKSPVCQWLISVPAVGRDECLRCWSNYSLNEALALVWVGRGSSREAPADQVSISDLLPLTFWTSKVELWQHALQKAKRKRLFFERCLGLDTFLTIYPITRGAVYSSTYCTEDLIAHRMPDWMD